MFGYGKIAEIDLTRNHVMVREVDEELAYEFIGGRGWASRIVFREVSRRIDGLDPENVLVVAAGPLCATTLDSGGRTVFGAISPQTGLYGDSNVGGYFGYRLRKAGFDALVIKGVSEEPSYLLVDDSPPVVLNADELWGRGSEQTDALLCKKHGEQASVASIGIAGENQVKYACINVDWNRKTRHGQAGRTGMGAVMGNKKLKAIVTKGSGKVSVAHPERLEKVAREHVRKTLKSDKYDLFKRQGTMHAFAISNELQTLPVYNYQDLSYPYAASIDGEAFEKNLRVRSRACSQCIIDCEGVSKGRDAEGREFETGVDYEAAGLIGSNLDLRDQIALMKANHLCDDLGLDTMTCGSVIGFVMECVQRGLLTKKDLGFEPKFGDVDAVYRLINMIAHRQRFGDVMAEGVKTLSDRVGKGSERFAMHVKSLEMSAWSARALPAMALSYATCDIGAHHNRSWTVMFDAETGRSSYGEDKVNRVIYLQHIRPVFEMLGICRFYWIEMGIEPEMYAEAYSAVTGKEHTVQELLFRSEKVWNLNRVMAILQRNISSKDDTLPERDFADPIPSGNMRGAKLDKVKFEQMLQLYYRKRGWDSHGRPSKEKLTELGLDDAAEALYS